MSVQKRMRLEIYVDDSLVFEVECESNRLRQELMGLKRKGVVSKRFRLREVDVLRVILLLGVEELRKKGIEELRSLLNTV